VLKAFQGAVLVLVCCSFVLFGCGVKEGEKSEPESARLSRVSCIGVLPIASMGEGESVPLYIPQKKNSRHAIQVMTEILSQELGGKNGIRFVDIEQIDALNMTGGESSLDIDRMVGKRINCNAILETTVNRFTERVGGRYSVESPASVAFEMRLISLEDGAVIWSAKFDETQKSVMENILEWKKANARGFVWLSAEELMREGIKGKLADSPFLNPAQE